MDASFGDRAETRSWWELRKFRKESEERRREYWERYDRDPAFRAAALKQQQEYQEDAARRRKAWLGNTLERMAEREAREAASVAPSTTATYAPPLVDHCIGCFWTDPLKRWCLRLNKGSWCYVDCPHRLDEPQGRLIPERAEERQQLIAKWEAEHCTPRWHFCRKCHWQNEGSVSHSSDNPDFHCSCLLQAQPTKDGCPPFVDASNPTVEQKTERERLIGVLQETRRKQRRREVLKKLGVTLLVFVFIGVCVAIIAYAKKPQHNVHQQKSAVETFPSSGLMDSWALAMGYSQENTPPGQAQMRQMPTNWTVWSTPGPKRIKLELTMFGRVANGKISTTNRESGLMKTFPLDKYLGRAGKEVLIIGEKCQPDGSPRGGFGRWTYRGEFPWGTYSEGSSPQKETEITGMVCYQMCDSASTPWDESFCLGRFTFHLRTAR